MPDPIVKVTWFDSHQPTTPWHPREDAVPDASPIESVGYLLSSGPDWITLYQSTWKDGVDTDVQGVYHIPRGCVVEVTPL